MRDVLFKDFDPKPSGHPLQDHVIDRTECEFDSWSVGVMKKDTDARLGLRVPILDLNAMKTILQIIDDQNVRNPELVRLFIWLAESTIKDVMGAHQVGHTFKMETWCGSTVPILISRGINIGIDELCLLIAVKAFGTDDSTLNGKGYTRTAEMLRHRLKFISESTHDPIAEKILDIWSEDDSRVEIEAHLWLAMCSLNGRIVTVIEEYREFRKATIDHVYGTPETVSEARVQFFNSCGIDPPPISERDRVTTKSKRVSGDLFSLARYYALGWSANDIDELSSMWPVPLSDEMALRIRRETIYLYTQDLKWASVISRVHPHDLAKFFRGEPSRSIANEIGDMTFWDGSDEALEIMLSLDDDGVTVDEWMRTLEGLDAMLQWTSRKWTNATFRKILDEDVTSVRHVMHIRQWFLGIDDAAPGATLGRVRETMTDYDTPPAWGLRWAHSV